MHYDTKHFNLVGCAIDINRKKYSELTGLCEPQ